MKKPPPLRFKQPFWLTLLVLMLLAACQPSPTLTPKPTSSPVRESLAPTYPPTATPSPQPTSTPSARPSATTAPTETATPTPTATSSIAAPALELTPLPAAGLTVTDENAAQVAHLAVWGKGRTNTMALSPNGRVMAVGTGLGVFLYDSLTYELLGLIQTESPVLAVAFSENDRWLALYQLKGTVGVYSRNDLNEVARFPFLEEALSSLSEAALHFSADNLQLISLLKTDQDLFLRVWDTENWEAEEVFPLDREIASFINPQTGILGVVDARLLTLTSLEDPEETITRKLPDEPGSFWDSFGYYPGQILNAQQGQYLLINNGRGVARWDIEADNFTYLIDAYPDFISSDCGTGPDTCLNINGGFSWDCPSGPGSPPVEMIALTPDEIMFLVSVNDGRTEFRRTVDGDLYWEIDVRYTTVSFSPGGEFFFGLLPNGTIEKRGTLDGALIDFLEGHPSRVLDIAFSPDGSILAGAFSDGWIRIFSTVNGQFLGVLTGQSHSLAFSPDGSLLGAGLTDGIIRIFQLEEGNFYDLSREHQAVVTDLAFSPDGSLLLSGSRDCTARLWDMSSRRAISTVNPGGDHPFRIFNVALVPQELRLFFTGNRNGVYSYQDDRPLSVFLESIYYPSDITADPNNNWMALTGPGTWLVDISQDGKPSQLTELDANPAANGYALAFSPAADLLVLSTIQDLEFWSVPEGVLLDHLNIDHQTQPNAWPEALAISPDGQLIALATHNGLIHIFGIPETSPD